MPTWTGAPSVARSRRGPSLAGSTWGSLRRVIADLVARGAQGVILGCTEMSLLVRQGDASVPPFDTTAILATAAERAVGGRASCGRHRKSTKPDPG